MCLYYLVRQKILDSSRAGLWLHTDTPHTHTKEAASQPLWATGSATTQVPHRILCKGPYCKCASDCQALCPMETESLSAVAHGWLALAASWLPAALSGGQFVTLSPYLLCHTLHCHEAMHPTVVVCAIHCCIFKSAGREGTSKIWVCSCTLN